MLPIRTATETKISSNEQISVEPLSQDIFLFSKVNVDTLEVRTVYNLIVGGSTTISKRIRKHENN